MLKYYHLYGKHKAYYIFNRRRCCLCSLTRKSHLLRYWKSLFPYDYTIMEQCSFPAVLLLSWHSLPAFRISDTENYKDLSFPYDPCFLGISTCSFYHCQCSQTTAISCVYLSNYPNARPIQINVINEDALSR